MNRKRYLERAGRLDYWLLLALLALAAYSTLFVYSAIHRGVDAPMSEKFYKHIAFWIAGLGVFLGVSFFDYRRLRPLNGWFYALALALLALVPVMGTTAYHATRWLNIFGFQFQPSEVAKLAVVLALASQLGERSPLARGGRLDMLKAFLIAGIPALLILEQPDLGTAAILVPVTLAMLWVAGIPLKYFLVLLGLGLLLLPVAWWDMDPYQKERVRVFFDSSRDPLGTGWNKIQSVIAVGSGGPWGKGYLQGTQNILGFLPRTVSPTDFIFPVIAEESGFMGSLGLLLLYAIVVFRGMGSALAAPDAFGRCLATGLTALLFTHLFVNIAMTIGLLPVTGVPLPLVSYGGSFMICMMVALGLIESIYASRVRES